MALDEGGGSAGVIDQSMNDATGQGFDWGNFWNGITNTVGGWWNDLTSGGGGSTPPPAPSGGPSPDTQDRINQQNQAAYQAYLASLHQGSGQYPPPGVNPYGAVYGSGGGGMSAYQQASLELDRQKEADQNAYWNKLISDAQAKNEMQKQLDESNGINAFNKDFRDYQNNHYYGAMYGPGFFAPNGAAQAYRAPEPYYVEQYYKDHPEAGADPFSQAPVYSGYQGSQFVNPQHPGMAAAPPVGSTGQVSGGNNPLPLGPELTGASGYGALVTADGTPVAASAWQRSHLDPTSLSHYDSYLGDIAGFNPKDFQNTSDQETGNIASLKAPVAFNGFASDSSAG